MVFPSAHLRTIVAGLMMAAAWPAWGVGTTEENSERAGEPLPADVALAAVECRLPAMVTLLATEPAIRNPVGACVDTAGRLIVAELLTYAEKPLRSDVRFRDRVTMLEDADGDGVAERRATLVDGLETLSSVAVGRGGLWLLCPPRLLFIPGGHRPPPGWPDAPDPAEASRRLGGAVVILDGFTVSPSSHHTFANGLAWGPDGWLYGRCGASSPGEIGPPDGDPGARVPLRGGIWRYHPERRVFEAVCHGTTNPWGLDWDDRGEGFFTNTVNGHLWRLLPGAHYARSHTVEPHPWVFSPLGPHADHDHFAAGRHWTESRDGKANAHGGGHAHAGCVIVPDETGWPAPLRGRLLTLNLHGRRINVDRLDAEPTGIVGRHEEDLATFGDPFFRGTELVELPGARLAALDWSDTGECHEGTGVHRTSGRIYRFDLSAADAPPAPVAPGTDLDTLDAAALIGLLSTDRWHARMAIRVLADRRAAGDPRGDLAGTVPALEDLLAARRGLVVRLRALLALWAIHALDEPDLWGLLDDPEPSIRVQAIRILADDWPIDTALGDRREGAPRIRGRTLDALERLAIAEADAEVRLALACALQRMPPGDRARIVRALVSATAPTPDGTSAGGPDFGPAPEASPRALGGDHHDLGAMLFVGLLPAISEDPEGMVAVWKAACTPGAEASHWPGLRRAIVRRLAADDPGHLLPRLLVVAAEEGEAGIDDCLAGLVAGWQGMQRADAPGGWDDLRAALAATAVDDARSADRLDLAARLDALFGDARGVERLVAVVRDRGLPPPRRATALDALADVRAADATTVARENLDDPDLALAAIRALLVAGDPADAARLVGACRRWEGPARDAALAALASRTDWGKTLLDAIERGDLPRDTLTPLVARQLAALGDEPRARVATLVGPGALPAEGSGRIEAWKARLTPRRLADADPAAGREVWAKQCQACHRLHGEGGALGPDLSGAGRHDLDYLLANIVTPSAMVSPDYRMRHLVLADGRVLSGIVARRIPGSVVLRTPSGEETVPAADVEEMIDSGISLMPEGILERLDEREAADLVRYLMEP